MSNDRDLLLMGRLAEDDEEAMAELLVCWQQPVLRFVCRFLGCGGEEARDLAQEAFLRVWRQRHRWRPDARFSTWLFTIVSNLCRNRKRDLSRRPVLVSAEDDESGERLGSLRSSSSDDPQARAEASELAERLRSTLQELPEMQRSALLLRRFQEMSYRQIAEVLGVTPSAVDSLLVRARRALVASLTVSAQETDQPGVEPRR